MRYSDRSGKTKYSARDKSGSGAVTLGRSGVMSDIADLRDTGYERVTTGIDRPFLVLFLVLIVIGSVMLFSASYVFADSRTGDSLYYIRRHIIFLVIGGFAALFGFLWPYTIYKKYAEIIFIVVCVTLVAVLLVGVSEGSAVRWIDFKLFTFQPSDAMKFSIVVLMAKYFDTLERRESGAKMSYRIRKIEMSREFVFEAAVPMLIIMVSSGLVMLERHLSGTIIVAFLGLCVYIAGGGKKRWAALFSGIAAGLLAIYLAISGGYQSNRILVWMNPEKYPRDGGWQTIQGMYAIGSGGLLGVGLGNSRLKYGYASMPHNDFVFSIVCEELGFIGAMAIIALFGLLVWRGFVIAMRAPDKFSSLVAIGISSQIAIQVLLNIAVVTNTIPNTGISLPFFSYGGTAIIILMFEIGVMLKISKHSYRKKTSEDDDESDNDWRRHGRAH